MPSGKDLANYSVGPRPAVAEDRARHDACRGDDPIELGTRESCFRRLYKEEYSEIEIKGRRQPW
jgi:hypothetical protein